MARMKFDATKVAPNMGFSVIPAGEYTVQIEKSEMVKNKSGSGEHLKLSMRIISSEYKGHMLFDRLNLFNKSKDAVEIAKGQLSAVCHAVDVKRIIIPDELQKLHGKPILINVSTEPGNDNYGETNRVQFYQKLEKDDNESWDDQDENYVDETEDENTIVDEDVDIDEENEFEDESIEDEEESFPWNEEDDNDDDADDDDTFPWDDEEVVEKPKKKIQTKKKSVKKQTANKTQSKKIRKKK